MLKYKSSKERPHPLNLSLLRDSTESLRISDNCNKCPSSKDHMHTSEASVDRYTIDRSYDACHVITYEPITNNLIIYHYKDCYGYELFTDSTIIRTLVIVFLRECDYDLLPEDLLYAPRFQLSDHSLRNTQRVASDLISYAKRFSIVSPASIHSDFLTFNHLFEKLDAFKFCSDELVEDAHYIYLLNNINKEKADDIKANLTNELDKKIFEGNIKGVLNVICDSHYPYGSFPLFCLASRYNMDGDMTLKLDPYYLELKYKDIDSRNIILKLLKESITRSIDAVYGKTLRRLMQTIAELPLVRHNSMTDNMIVMHTGNYSDVLNGNQDGRSYYLVDGVLYDACYGYKKGTTNFLMYMNNDGKDTAVIRIREDSELDWDTSIPMPITEELREVLDETYADLNDEEY